MPINKGLEYTVLDMIESATRNSRAMPLNLGGIAGVGGGAGGPPGGFIGRLPQYNVAYDITEAATLDTMPSGQTGSSGWSLVDNLNHIRYRLSTVESGVSSAISGIIIIDDNNSLTYSDIDTVHFSGAGVTVLDLGGGDVRVTISGTGEVEEAPIDGNTYGRNTGAWVIFSGGTGDVEEAPLDGDIYGRQNGTWVAISGGSSNLIVNEYDGTLAIDNVTRIVFSGADVVNGGSGIALVVIPSGALHIYNEDLTSQAGGRIFTTSMYYAPNTLRVYHNGLRLRKGIQYLDDVDFIVFSTYFDTASGDMVVVDYDYYVLDQIPDNALVDLTNQILTDSDGNILIT